MTLDLFKRDTTYIVLLLAMFLLSGAVAFLLIPVVFALGWVAYFIIVFLGLILGYLINHFIHDLRDITVHHHLGVWIVAIFGSLYMFWIIFTRASSIVFVNPLVIGITFSISFIIPLLLGLVKIAKK